MIVRRVRLLFERKISVAIEESGTEGVTFTKVRIRAAQQCRKAKNHLAPKSPLGTSATFLLTFSKTYSIILNIRPHIRRA